MLNFEEKFRLNYPDCKVEEEWVSSNLTRYHVIVGKIHCSESGIREMAFKYALDDIREGKLSIPAGIEQGELWPLRG